MMYHMPNPEIHAQMKLTDIELANLMRGSSQPVALNANTEKACESLKEHTKLSKKVVHKEEPREVKPKPAKKNRTRSKKNKLDKSAIEELRKIKAKVNKYNQRIYYDFRLSKEAKDGLFISYVGEGKETVKKTHKTEAEAKAASIAYNKSVILKLRARVKEIKWLKNG